jgi:hypothetical protein
VLLKESGTIWCLPSITINPTITVVAILTDKCIQGRCLWVLFVNFDCALNNGFVHIKCDGVFVSKACDYRNTKAIFLFLSIAHVTVK